MRFTHSWSARAGFALVVVLTTGLPACRDTPTQPTAGIDAHRLRAELSSHRSPGCIEASPAAATLLLGGSVQILATAYADTDCQDEVRRQFSYSSDNETVATVTHKGVVTGVAPGETTIRVTSGTTEAVVEITVEELRPETMASGQNHTCGLTVSGAAYCWGHNFFGQLGDGTNDQSLVPVAVSGGATFASLSSGLWHTCGVDMEGTAYCWGRGDGQLGTGKTGHQNTPTKVFGRQTWIMVSAGQAHTCGVDGEHQAYCWGQASFGQLGTGGTGAETRPRPVVGDLAFRSVSSGGHHTCGVTVDDHAYCWGHNSAGQLGTGSFGGQTAEPVAVTGGLPFAAVAGGAAHTCGITTLGDSFCWGFNNRGQLGTGSMDDQHTPTLVLGEHSFQVLSSGVHLGHTCGITTTNALYCWGRNDHGQLGIGSTDDQHAPTAVAGGRFFRTISVGVSHTCGVMTEGDAYCWGWNGDGSGDFGNGRLGTGTTNEEHEPAAVFGGHSFQ